MFGRSRTTSGSHRRQPRSATWHPGEPPPPEARKPAAGPPRPEAASPPAPGAASPRRRLLRPAGAPPLLHALSPPEPPRGATSRPRPPRRPATPARPDPAAGHRIRPPPPPAGRCFSSSPTNSYSAAPRLGFRANPRSEEVDFFSLSPRYFQSRCPCSRPRNFASVDLIHAYSILKCSPQRVHHFIPLYHFHLSSS